MIKCGISSQWLNTTDACCEDLPLKGFVELGDGSTLCLFITQQYTGPFPQKNVPKWPIKGEQGAGNSTLSQEALPASTFCCPKAF